METQRPIFYLATDCIMGLIICRSFIPGTPVDNCKYSNLCCGGAPLAPWLGLEAFWSPKRPHTSAPASVGFRMKPGTIYQKYPLNSCKHSFIQRPQADMWSCALVRLAGAVQHPWISKSTDVEPLDNTGVPVLYLHCFRIWKPILVATEHWLVLNFSGIMSVVSASNMICKPF